MFFKTLIRDIQITDSLKVYKNFKLFINFAGFRKFWLNYNDCCRSSDHSHNSSDSNTISFDYKTIYPKNLNVKYLHLKCFKVNKVGYKTNIGFGQVDLYTLATGPSKYKIILKNKKPESQHVVTITFTCIFTEYCPCLQYSLSDCIIDITDNNSNSDNSNTVKIKNQNIEFHAKTVLELDTIAIPLNVSSELIYLSNLTLPIMINYNPKRQDQWISFTHESNHFDDCTKVVTKMRIGGQFRIVNGPTFHQMSPLALATEEGVIFGHSMINYPMPNRYAKNCVVGLIIPRVDVRDFRDVSDKCHIVPKIPWNEMENLIHKHFHDLLKKHFETQNTRVTISLQKFKEDEQKRQNDFKIALVNVENFSDQIKVRLEFENKEKIAKNEWNQKIQTDMREVQTNLLQLISLYQKSLVKAKNRYINAEI